MFAGLLVSGLWVFDRCCVDFVSILFDLLPTPLSVENDFRSRQRLRFDIEKIVSHKMVTNAKGLFDLR